MAPAFVYQGMPPAALRRSVIEDMVQRLVDLLDDLDGDADTEPANDDEPTLGWPEGYRGGSVLDSEDGEREPSLGSLDRQAQDRWAPAGSTNPHGSAFECEADAGDEGEPDED